MGAVPYLKQHQIQIHHLALLFVPAGSFSGARWCRANAIPRFLIFRFPRIRDHIEASSGSQSTWHSSLILLGMLDKAWPVVVVAGASVCWGWTRRRGASLVAALRSLCLGLLSLDLLRQARECLQSVSSTCLGLRVSARRSTLPVLGSFLRPATTPTATNSLTLTALLILLLLLLFLLARCCSCHDLTHFIQHSSSLPFVPVDATLH